MATGYIHIYIFFIMTVSTKCAWKWECASTPMHTDLYQKQLHWSLSRNQTRLPMQAEKNRTRSYNPPIATITGRVFKICVALLYNDQEGIFISNNVDDSLVGWFQLLVNPVWVLTGQDFSYFSITCLPHLWGVALLLLQYVTDWWAFQHVSPVPAPQFAYLLSPRLWSLKCMDKWC